MQLAESTGHRFPRLPWWQQYLWPSLHRQNRWSQSVPTPTFSAYTVPAAILLLAVFVCTFWILSDEYFLEQVTAKAHSRATTEEQQETIERAREATKLAFENPSARIWVGLKITWAVARTFFVFLVFSWLLLSWISGKWDLFLQFYLLALTSTSTISIGIVVHTILRIVLQEEIVGLSPVVLIQRIDFSNPAHFLLARIDLFTAWFLWVLSMRASRAYGESIPIVLSLIFGGWLVLILLSFLLDIRFYFLP